MPAAPVRGIGRCRRRLRRSCRQWTGAPCWPCWRPPTSHCQRRQLQRPRRPSRWHRCRCRRSQRRLPAQRWVEGEGRVGYGLPRPQCSMQSLFWSASIHPPSHPPRRDLHSNILAMAPGSLHSTARAAPATAQSSVRRRPGRGHAGCAPGGGRGLPPTSLIPFLSVCRCRTVVGDFRKLITVSVFRTQTIPELARREGLTQEAG